MVGRWPMGRRVASISRIGVSLRCSTIELRDFGRDTMRTVIAAMGANFSAKASIQQVSSSSRPLIMIVWGPFKIELVDATTKEALKVHEKEGKLYAETEPEQQVLDAIQKMATPAIDYVLRIHVDDKSLGYTIP